MKKLGHALLRAITILLLIVPFCCSEFVKWIVPRVRRIRMIEWTSVTILLVACNVYLQENPKHIAQELLFKVVMVPLFGVIGYWLDRAIAPYGRPHAFSPFGGVAGVTPRPDLPSAVLFSVAMIRRAIIVAACIFAGTMGI